MVLAECCLLFLTCMETTSEVRFVFRWHRWEVLMWHLLMKVLLRRTVACFCMVMKPICTSGGQSVMIFNFSIFGSVLCLNVPMNEAVKKAITEESV